ncbi:MAG: FAD-binding oxidoreductase [Actinomycetota bacterium]|nr:FAD-binding oxidoreductase [Actinomycetota bacterium]
MTSKAAPKVVVIGAGVIGLSTAVCLAERGERVEVRASLGPTQTTSAVASAMIGPAMAPADDETGRRERASIAEFTALANVKGTGVTMRRGRLASRKPLPAPAGLTPCAASDIPPGFAGASWATLPLVEMPVYLAYLAERLTAAGGRIQLRSVSSLGELAAELPLIVNCAGLGAAALTGDDSLTPIRGQQVIVDNPGLEEFFIEAPFSPAWAAYWPYPDHVVLGGTQSTEDTSTEPDPQIAEQIRQRCIEVEPRLRDAAVRAHQVGLRPARPTVRLEAEQIGAARCVHNYGHGGSGVTLSWGTAFAAAALLLGP